MNAKELISALIYFQIHLNDLGLITNHDWDYEKVAKKFTSAYQVKKAKIN